MIPARIGMPIEAAGQPYPLANPTRITVNTMATAEIANHCPRR